MVEEDFWECGYAIIEDCLDEAQLAFVREAMEFSSRDKVFATRGGAHSHAIDEYSTVAGETLLRFCRPRFEAVIGQPLLDSYSFWRIYGPGGELRRHTDRAACEISATVAIHSEPAGTCWPINIEDLKGRTRAIELRAGAALLYQGHRIAHWRHQFTGLRQMQLFFHYVLKNGKFSDHVFDCRGQSPIIRNTYS